MIFLMLLIIPTSHQPASSVVLLRIFEISKLFQTPPNNSPKSLQYVPAVAGVTLPQKIRKLKPTKLEKCCRLVDCRLYMLSKQDETIIKRRSCSFNEKSSATSTKRYDLILSSLVVVVIVIVGLLQNSVMFLRSLLYD